MEFFLKRVPAFSRALGDWDSDDSSSEDVEPVSQVNLKPIYNKPISYVIITTDALATAFVVSGLKLNTRDSCEVIRIQLENETSASVVLYYLPNECSGTLVISFDWDIKYLSFMQKSITKTLLNPLVLQGCGVTSIKSVSVICSTPSHNYVSNSEISSIAFIRQLSTNFEKSSELPFPELEQPNIVTGLPAEILTWCHFHSLPTVLYVAFFSPNINISYTWSIIKEIFNCLLPINKILPPLRNMNDQWDMFTDNIMINACTNLISGHKPLKQDQMYT